MRYTFSSASGNTTDADVPALDDPSPSDLGPLALAAPHLCPDVGIRGDDAHRAGDLGAADLDRRVDAVDEHALLAHVELEVVRDPCDIVVLRRVDAPAQRGEGHPAIHRARVEVLEVETLRKGSGHSRLARSGRPVDGDHAHRSVTLPGVGTKLFQGVEVAREGLAHTVGISDRDAGHGKAEDREAHRHAVVAVRLDLRPMGRTRLHDEAVIALRRRRCRSAEAR